MNYKVYQGSELKQTVTSKTAVMNGLQPNKTYEFSVEPDNTQTVRGRTRYTHTAWSRSSDGVDGFSISYPGENLFSVRDWHSKPELLRIDIPYMNIQLEPNTEYTLTTNVTLNSDGWSDVFFFKDDEIPSSATSGSSSGSGRSLTTSSTGNVKVGVRNQSLSDGTNWIKLEKGATATPWYPSPTDDPIKAYPSYIGQYTDFTQTASTNPLDYTWNPNAKTSVTTRGIRFNIPKTLTVGSTITLRYEEYPLGIVPIGKEPSGYFGGGNKQKLSAKVVSTENGSSVVEVAGNVIDVGRDNLITNSSTPKDIIRPDWNKPYPAWTNILVYSGLKNNETYTFSALATVESPNQSAEKWGVRIYQDNGNHESSKHDFDGNTGKRQSFTFTTPDDGVSYNVLVYSGGVGVNYTPSDLKIVTTISDYKLELGDIATPYAAFVDGSTFTKQSDGKFALFTEYKALYY